MISASDPGTGAGVAASAGTASAGAASADVRPAGDVDTAKRVSLLWEIPIRYLIGIFIDALGRKNMSAKVNTPLVIPPYQVDGTDYSWKGKSVYDPRFLPVLWNEKNIKFVNGTRSLNYVGKLGQIKAGRVIRPPRTAVGLPFQMYNDFLPGYQEGIDRVGLLISDLIYPVGVGWNLLTQLCLFDHDGDPIPADHFVGGEAYAVTQLDLHANQYDQYFTTAVDSFTYDRYRPIVETLPGGLSVFRGWEAFETGTYQSRTTYLSTTVELPGLARDIDLIKAALKRYARVRMVIGIPPQDFRYYSAASGVGGPFFVDIPFGQSLPPITDPDTRYIDQDKILTGPSPAFPSDPLMWHYWYELGYTDREAYNNGTAIDQYIALVNQTASRIGSECVVMNMDLDVETAIQEDIATFFGL